MRWLACAALLLVAIAVTSCTRNSSQPPDLPALANESAEQRVEPFDPDKSVTSIWARERVVGSFEKKAGPFVQVRELAAKSPDEAGARFGYRAKSEGTPWTLIVRIDGVIVRRDYNDPARRRSMLMFPVKQRPTLAIQIGPAIRGTAIRDALDFVSFNDFTNQIDGTQFGKAFNTHVYRETLEKLPRESLIGRKVSSPRGLLGSLDGRHASGDAGRDYGRPQAMKAKAPRTGQDVVLRLEGVSKVYSGTVAVKHADFEVRSGAVDVPRRRRQDREIDPG